MNVAKFMSDAPIGFEMWLTVVRPCLPPMSHPSVLEQTNKHVEPAQSDAVSAMARAATKILQQPHQPQQLPTSSVEMADLPYNSAPPRPYETIPPAFLFLTRGDLVPDI